MIITDKNLLLKPCEEANLFEIDIIIKKLEEELSKSQVNVVGLAANQIDIQKKVCIIHVNEPINLVNPIIIKTYDLMEFHGEGCLSFPNKFITTKRYNEIVVKDALHPAGIICVGYEAVVVQHEIAHLQGKTMYDFQIKIPKPNDICWCGQRKYKKCHQGKIIK